jgi:hypothetical protein
MSYNAQFEQPAEYKLILRDSYEDNTYYGLDEFDCKYLKSFRQNLVVITVTIPYLSG